MEDGPSSASGSIIDKNNPTEGLNMYNIFNERKEANKNLCYESIWKGYDYINQNINDLISKASTIIMFAGAILTILGTVAWDIFNNSKISNNYNNYMLLLFLFTLGCSLVFLSIILALRAYQIRNYKFIPDIKNIYEDCFVNKTFKGDLRINLSKSCKEAVEENKKQIIGIASNIKWSLRILSSGIFICIFFIIAAIYLRR